jgi:hypothetical protein
MASFSELRDAIIAVLDADLPDDVHTYARVVDRANLPAIVVEPADATFPFTSAAAEDEWQFDLIVMTSARDVVLAQEELDAFLSGSGVTSIRQIFMRNKNLGRNDVLAAYVSGMSSYGVSFAMAGVDNLGCRLRVIVATTGPTWG